MKITLRVKIFAIIILLIIMALIMGIFSFVSMRKAATNTENMSQKYMYVYTLNSNIGLNSMDFRRFFYVLQRTPSQENLATITKYGQQTTDAMDNLNNFIPQEEKQYARNQFTTKSLKG